MLILSLIYGILILILLMMPLSKVKYSAKLGGICLLLLFFSASIKSLADEECPRMKDAIAMDIEKAIQNTSCPILERFKDLDEITISQSQYHAELQQAEISIDGNFILKNGREQKLKLKLIYKKDRDDFYLKKIGECHVVRSHTPII